MNTPSDTAKPGLAPKARLKWDAVREKPLLLFPEGVLVLNPTAHKVLALCDGQRTVAEIIKTLSEEFGGAPVDNDVRELLSKLAEKKLVVIGVADARVRMEIPRPYSLIQLCRADVSLPAAMPVLQQIRSTTRCMRRN